MKNPNVRVIVEGGTIDVAALAPDVTIEVRDYDSQTAGRGGGGRWTDERGKACIRYFVAYDGHAKADAPNTCGLERFAEDLQAYAGAEVAFEPDKSGEGLHVLTINNVDYYFCADGSGYDGWGKRVGGVHGARETGSFGETTV